MFTYQKYIRMHMKLTFDLIMVPHRVRPGKVKCAAETRAWGSIENGPLGDSRRGNNLREVTKRCITFVSVARAKYTHWYALLALGSPFRTAIHHSSCYTIAHEPG